MHIHFAFFLMGIWLTHALGETTLLAMLFLTLFEVQTRNLALNFDTMWSFDIKCILKA